MFERIAAILAEYKDMDIADIKMESTFAELQVDSLDTVELIMNIEDEFGVVIEMNENIQTVGDLVKIIQGQES